MGSPSSNRKKWLFFSHLVFFVVYGLLSFAYFNQGKISKSAGNFVLFIMTVPNNIMIFSARSWLGEKTTSEVSIAAYIFAYVDDQPNTPV